MIADPLATYGRWFALAIGAVMVLMAWRPLVDGRHARVSRLAPAGHRRADAGGLGGEPRALVRGTGVDLDPDLHPLVAGAPRPGRPGSGRQVFLSERALLGNLALRPELPLWRHRHDATDRLAALAAGCAHGLRAAEQSGHGPGRRRALLPRDGRAVSLLRPGRLPGHDPGQRGLALRAAQGGRTPGLGAAGRAGHARKWDRTPGKSSWSSRC